MNVRIPRPLRSYTNPQALVTATGATVSGLLDDLELSAADRAERPGPLTR